MLILKPKLAQYEEGIGQDPTGDPIKLITDPESLLDPKGILSCFRNVEEESRSENIEENIDRKRTINLGEFSSPVIRLPAISRRSNNMASLQKWQGYVIKVLNEALLVRLIDLTHKGPDEEAEIPIEEISQDDRGLIRPGAIFYWNIGYLDSYNGQRTRISVIRFQRLPAWSKEEIDAAEREAERLQQIIGWK